MAHKHINTVVGIAYNDKLRFIKEHKKRCEGILLRTDISNQNDIASTYICTECGAFMNTIEEDISNSAAKAFLPLKNKTKIDAFIHYNIISADNHCTIVQ